MLIDTSYFFGDLTIAQSSEASVAASIQQFINKYEVEFMNAILGRELYRDFKAGLQAVTVAQKWIDLLYGKEFNYFGYQTDYWIGFVSPQEDMSLNVYWPPDLEIVVGSGAQYAPAANSTALHNPYLIGKQYRVLRRGIGEMLTSEYTQLSDGISLPAPDEFINGEILFIQFTAPTALPDPTVITPLTQKNSPIANYVYFKYMRDNASFTTGSGEKIIDQQSATNVGPGYKMMLAWNQMCDWNTDLIKFLRANRATYPYQFAYYDSWNPRLYNLVTPVNMFNV